MYCFCFAHLGRASPIYCIFGTAFPSQSLGSETTGSICQTPAMFAVHDSLATAILRTMAFFIIYSYCGLEHFLFLPTDSYFSEGLKPPTRL